MDTEKVTTKRAGEKRKRTTAVVMAAVASAGAVTNGLFTDPDELTAPEDSSPPLADTLLPDGGPDGGDEDEDVVADEDEDEEKKGWKTRLKQKILNNVPPAVRSLVGVPLWAVGNGLSAALSALWGSVLSPMAQTLLQWVLLAAGLLGAVCLGVKAAFPEVPVRKILTRRNFSFLLAGTALLATLDAALPFLWGGYEKISDLFHVLGTGALSGGVTWTVVRKEIKKRRKLAEEKAAEAERIYNLPENRQARALKNVLDMADEAAMKER